MQIKSSMEKKLAVKNTIRWILYILLILFCYSVMCAGTGKRPLLLIPAAICISSFTGELQAAFLGTSCGFLIDIGCFRILGFNALILCFFCTVTSLLHNNILRNRLFNIIVITSAAAFIQGLLDYQFNYGIWKYEGAHLIFRKYTLQICIMTSLSTFIVYGVIVVINKFLIPKRQFTIQEAIKQHIKEEA